MSRPDKAVDELDAWDDHGNPTRTVADIIEQARLGLPWSRPARRDRRVMRRQSEVPG